MHQLPGSVQVPKLRSGRANFPVTGKNGKQTNSALEDSLGFTPDVYIRWRKIGFSDEENAINDVSTNIMIKL